MAQRSFGFGFGRVTPSVRHTSRVNATTSGTPTVRRPRRFRVAATFLLTVSAACTLVLGSGAGRAVAGPTDAPTGINFIEPGSYGLPGNNYCGIVGNYAPVG